jgi:hypothetical protein
MGDAICSQRLTGRIDSKKHVTIAIKSPSSHSATASAGASPHAMAARKLACVIAIAASSVPPCAAGVIFLAAAAVSSSVERERLLPTDEDDVPVAGPLSPVDAIMAVLCVIGGMCSDRSLRHRREGVGAAREHSFFKKKIYKMALVDGCSRRQTTERELLQSQIGTLSFLNTADVWAKPLGRPICWKQLSASPPPLCVCDRQYGGRIHRANKGVSQRAKVRGSVSMGEVSRWLGASDDPFIFIV